MGRVFLTSNFRTTLVGELQSQIEATFQELEDQINQGTQVVAIDAVNNKLPQGMRPLDVVFDLTNGEFRIGVYNGASIQYVSFGSFTGAITDAQHGNRAGGSLHPAATISVAGFMSAADKVALNAAFTLPSLTNGSIIFSNGTTLVQDNANLFWDDTNNRLGVGTNSPPTTFHIGAVGYADCQADLATQCNAFISGKTNLTTTFNIYETVLTLGRKGITGSIYPAHAQFVLGNTANGYSKLYLQITRLGIPYNVMGWGVISGTTAASVEYIGFADFNAIGDGTAIVSVSDSSGAASTSQGKLRFRAGGTTTGYISGQYNSGTLRLVFGGGNTNTDIDLAIYDNGNIAIGLISTPSARLHIISTTEQLRVGYDTSNYFSTTVSSAGVVTFDAVGASARFDFSDAVKFVGGTQSSDGSTGITATITTAALTGGGAQGSMTFKDGILTAQTQAT